MKVFSLLFIALSGFSLTEFSAETGFFQRLFKNDGNPITESYNPAIGLKLKFKHKNESFKAKVIIDSLYDFVDKDRFYLYPEEAWIGFDDGDDIIKLGFQHLNWSSTEAFRPSDIINSRNFDGMIKNANKIGEPMISYKSIFDNSSIMVFYAPTFIKPLLPGMKNSFGAFPDFNKTEVIKSKTEVDDDIFHHQFGAIFNFTLGKSDIAIHYANHIDRSEPIFPIIFLNPFVPIEVIPTYYRVSQVGLTSQTAIFESILKTEFVYRNYLDYEGFIKNSTFFNKSTLDKKDHFIGTMGIEKNFSLGEGELTILAEAISTFSASNSQRNSAIFDRDALLGFRYAFNDTQGKEINFSIISDLKDFHQHIINLDYSQRIYENWKIETGINFVDSIVKDNYFGAEGIDTADYVYLNLKRFF